MEQPAPLVWVAFTITASAADLRTFLHWLSISTGVGTGDQVPVGWAWDITNFVFWIGIGHAGTLISGDLLLRQNGVLDQSFRGSDDTLCVICAAIFPGIHVGRFWMACA